MPHVYQGEPDARQEGDITPSRFRPRYRELSDGELDLHDAIKTKAEDLAELFENVKDGRYRSLALTNLELAVMWIIKELTS